MKSIVQFLGGAVGWVVSQSGLLNLLPHGVQVAVTAVAGILTVLGIHNAAQTTPSVADLLNKLPGNGWKTIIGAVIWAIGTLSSDPTVGSALGQSFGHILTVLGTVLAALGLYHAQAKAGGV